MRTLRNGLCAVPWEPPHPRGSPLSTYFLYVTSCSLASTPHTSRPLRGLVSRLGMTDPYNFLLPPNIYSLDLQKSWTRSTMNSHMPFVLTSQLLTLCPIWSISDPSGYFSYHPPLFSEPAESTLCYPSLPCLNTPAWEQGSSATYHCSLSHSKHFPWSSHTAQYPFYLAGFVLNQDSVNYHALYLVVNSLVSFDLTQLPAFTSHS